jgi:hypothetical protein
MKRAAWILMAGALIAWNAAAKAQSGAEAGASVDHKTAVSANQANTQAGSSTSGSASAQAGQNSANISTGTEMQAVLTQPLDARKSKPGDTVTAKTTQAVKSQGQVIIPKGSRLVGHVTEAKARANGEAQSALGIVFDKAILKNGQEVPLHASIQALAAAQTMASTSPSDDVSASGMGSAAGSARGAGGGVLGGAGSAVGGATSTVTNTSANAGGAATGAIDSTTSAAGSAAGNVASGVSGTVSGTSQGAVGGLNSAGQFTSSSHGVFGLSGLNLSSAASNSTEGSLITSTGKNVHLDSGTRMLLVAQGNAEGSVGHQQQ